MASTSFSLVVSKAKPSFVCKSSSFGSSIDDSTLLGTFDSVDSFSGRDNDVFVDSVTSSLKNNSQNLTLSTFGPTFGNFWPLCSPGSSQLSHADRVVPQVPQNGGFFNKNVPPVCIDLLNVTSKKKVPLTYTKSAPPEGSPCSYVGLRSTVTLPVITDAVFINLDALSHSLTRDSTSILLVDCRPFLKFNVCHIEGSLNISCNDRFKKKRLLTGKLTLSQVVSPPEAVPLWKMRRSKRIVIYDEFTSRIGDASDGLQLVLSTLVNEGCFVEILKGGISDFKCSFGSFCRSSPPPQYNEVEQTVPTPVPLECTAISEVLPFLYLGNERDSLCPLTLSKHKISFVLNVTQQCHLAPGMDANGGKIVGKRLEVSDSGFQDIRKFFNEAFEFIETARLSGGRVLIHCLAGVSRSATITIAYLMKFRKMNLNEAYMFVKAKRSVISPNLNFMGQLHSYQEELGRMNNVDGTATTVPEHTISLGNVQSPTSVEMWNSSEPMEGIMSCDASENNFFDFMTSPGELDNNTN